ncbi:hypothetical protein ACFXKG_23745 [Streptomyces sp. NPDC059255]|uniref:hypothetical protein n=1 Tax=Streptomyces sp. NPDC059255 TaxID=3346793 RepID=UPI00367C7165
MPVIEQYVKSDGTVVRKHFRLPAGARRETAILGAIVAGVFILGNGNTTAGTGIQQEQLRLPRQQPQPQPAVVYPIKRPGWDRPAVQPTPTVSYPIVFPRPRSGR